MAPPGLWRYDRVDPDNMLYGRMSVRRLESEVVRDSVLEICGQLNRKTCQDRRSFSLSEVINTGPQLQK